MPPEAHSSFGPSVIARRLACPGSAREEAKHPDPPPNCYAEEGTAAHWLAEQTLLGNFDPASKLGQLVATPAGTDILVTQEMVDGVKLYASEILTRQREMSGSKLHVEKQFRLDGVPEVWGTNDASIVQPLNTITVYDFKYGRKFVDPEWNPQLLCYALGAAQGQMVESFRLCIIQPRGIRGNQIRYWPSGDEEPLPMVLLNKWKEDTLIPGVAHCKVKKAPLCPGDHCQWCKAKLNNACPAVDELVQETCLSTFEDKSLPDPNLLDLEEGAKVLRFADLLESWVKSVKARFLRDWERGKPMPPGWKVVQGRRTRSWRDKAVAKDVMESVLGYSHDEPPLLTPAKALRAAGKKKEKIEALERCISETRKPGLVPEEDKRPAITHQKEVFKELE